MPWWKCNCAMTSIADAAATILATQTIPAERAAITHCL
jgi:hypothetical protein